MSKPRQATLFQSWGNSSKASQHSQNKSCLTEQQLPRINGSGILNVQQNEIISLLDDDEDDQLLTDALEETLAQCADPFISAHSTTGTSYYGNEAEDTSTAEVNENMDSKGNISFGIEEQEQGSGLSHCLSQWKTTDQPVGDLSGFDAAAGRLWIYPTNYPMREYQFNIVKQALLKNTLVTLPTGLGKTFIASVLMYNFYRWYPEGKIVFMAPTKPLVAQQIDACYNIMGIPKADTAEMTGSMNPADREKAWRDRRVFFLTPQVMTNDLSRGSCPAVAVKCLVVDEAHKALGNHAYCQVVRELMKYTQQFRVLALSATPGSDIKSVQSVISNLAISHIELRSEESIDIKPYTHERTVDKIVVPLGDELNSIKTKYTQVLSVVVRRLISQRVLYNREATSLSKFLILKAREAFRQNPPESMQRSQYGIVEGDFALAMSLYHGYELLQLHGLRSLYNFLDGIVSGDKSYGRTRAELVRNADFNEIMSILQNKFQQRPDTSTNGKTAILAGHPKMIKLEEVVLEHFNRFKAEGQATRVMIFSQYRDSVQEITAILQQHHPLVKVMSFIGQSSVGKSTKGFTQKEQLKVMQEFRTGGYNTLVSTCVGEEGLDIGDVDLIICFDAHKSPIRLVQRMGRTGRKRQGRIVMLVTEGKEEQIYNTSQYTKRSILKAILNGARTLVFYSKNPRLVPCDITPACHRMHITVKPAQLFNQNKDSQMKIKNKGQQGKRSTLHSHLKGDQRSTLEDGGISVEEFAELKASGTAFTAPTWAAPQMISLQPRLKNLDSSADGDVLEMDLAEWLPWQNSLQQTSLFGHSWRSQHLVDLLEFTDLQQAMPPDEDNYGQEMRLYLDMEDVMAESIRPASNNIAQFVVSSPRKIKKGSMNQANCMNNPNKRKMANPIRTAKIRERLKPIEIEEESEDSDFLPEVDIFAHHTSKILGKTTISDKESGRCENQVSYTPEKDKHFKIVCMRASLDVDKAVVEKDVGDDIYAEESRDSEDQCAPAEGQADRWTPEGQADRWAGVKRFCLPCPPLQDEAAQYRLLTVKAIKSVNIEDVVKQCDLDENDMEEVKFGPFSYIPAKPPSTGIDKRDSKEGCTSSEYGSARQTLIISTTAARKSTDMLSIQGQVDDNSEMEIVYPSPCRQNVSVMNNHCQPCFDTSTTNHDNLHICEDNTSASQAGKEKFKSAVFKSRKQLFRCDTMKCKSVNESCLENNTQDSVLKDSKRISFVYSFSQRSCSQPGAVNDVREIAVASKLKGSPLQVEKNISHCSAAFMAFPASADENIDVDKASNWLNSKHLLCSDTTRKETFRSGEDSFKCLSLSESFLAGELSEAEPGIRSQLLEGKAYHDAAAEPIEPERVRPASLPSSPSPQPLVLSPPGPGPGPDTSAWDGNLICKNDSMVTFTQALACVHNGLSLAGGSQENQCKLLKVSPSKPCLQVCEPVQSIESSHQRAFPPLIVDEEEDSANFDLGFDFDEDIIPPSPEAEITTSMLPVRSIGLVRPFPSVVGLSQASSKHKQQESVLVGDVAEVQSVSKQHEETEVKIDGTRAITNSAGFEDNVDEEVLVQLLNEEKEDDFPCFSLSSQLKPSYSTLPNGGGLLADVERVDKGANCSSHREICEQMECTLPITRTRKNSSPSQALNFPNSNVNFQSATMSHTDAHKSVICENFGAVGCSIEESHRFDSTIAPAVRKRKLSDEIETPNTKQECTQNPQPKKKLCYKETDAPIPVTSMYIKSYMQPGKVNDNKMTDASSQGFQSHENWGTDSLSFAEEPLTTSEVAHNKTLSEERSKPHLRLSSIGLQQEDFDDVEEELEHFVPNFDLNADLEDDWDTDENRQLCAAGLTKTSVQSCVSFTEGENRVTVKSSSSGFLGDKISSAIYHSTPLVDRKTKDSGIIAIHKQQMHMLHEVDSGSDFDESIITTKKTRKAIKQLSFSESESVSDKKKTVAKQKSKVVAGKAKTRRKHVCGFIDDEAEMSDDVEVSSDEADDNLDMMEGSFIDNGTQLTQFSHTDMQAVYLKSVRSPAHPKGSYNGRFHLQYNYAYTDVYSQPARHVDEEESQYQEDSFCVGSDDEEESSYASTVTEEESLVRSAVKKASKSRPNRQRKQQAVEQVKGRRRLHQLADSSEEEDNEVNRLPPTQVSPQPGQRKAVKAARLLLSTSEENADTSLGDFSPVLHRQASNQPSDNMCVQPSHTTQSHSKNLQLKTPSSGQVGIIPFTTISEASDGKNDMSNAAVTNSPEKVIDGRQDSCKTDALLQQQCNQKDRGNNESCGFGKSLQKLSLARPPSLLSPSIGAESLSLKNTATVTTCSGGSSCRNAQISNCLVIKSTHASTTSTEAKVDDGDGGKAVAQNNTSTETKFTSITPIERGTKIILVDSREISGAQDVISALRIEHHIQIFTRQLTACDYILSNRMALDRINWSNFSNGANKSKLMERLQLMLSLYDRCVVIVERDRVKAGEEKPAKPKQYSRYVETLLAQIYQTAIQIFFTENQGETAKLIADLFVAEQHKGMAISVPVNLSPQKEQVFKFYSSIPKLTVTHALNLCFNFKSVHDFINSPISQLQSRGHMSFSRATQVANFVHHRFLPALTTTK